MTPLVGVMATFHLWGSGLTLVGVMATFHSWGSGLTSQMNCARTLPGWRSRLTSIILPATLGITAFLCALNIVFAYVFRKRRLTEVLSYLGVGLLEVVIFVFALLLRLGVLHGVPLHLPPHLPFNRAEIGATIAIGIGLFPAGYWHRTSVAQMRAKMAQDAKVMKQRESGVRVHSGTPGEWMN